MGLSPPHRSPEAERGIRDLARMTAGRLGTQVVLVISAVVIPRVLGVESYGVFAAVMAVLAIAQAASAFGLPLVEVRFLAPLWRLGERAPALALGSSIWAARLALGAAGAAATALWLALSGELGLGQRLWGLLGLLALLRFFHEGTKSLLLPLGHVGKLAAFDFARAALTLPVVIGLFPAFGLAGVFAGMAALQALLLAASTGALRAAAPLRPDRFRWSSLRPHLPYSAATYVAALSSMLQAQLAVYAVANWGARGEAAFLGIAVQLFAFLQVLYLSGRRVLMPGLAELQIRGETRRLAQWGGTMLRYSVAGMCVLLVLWGWLGAELVRVLLTDAFAPVHPCAALLLLAALFYCCGASCNGLLFVGGGARLGAANALLFALVTLAGLVLALRGEPEGVALRVARVYAVAAALFAVSAWASLGWSAGLWLPLRRTLLLAAPAALAWIGWEAPALARLAASAAFLALYAGLALGLGLLPPAELREIAGALRRRR